MLRRRVTGRKTFLIYRRGFKNVDLNTREVSLNTCYNRKSIASVDTRWIFTSETRVQSWVVSIEIRSGHCSKVSEFFRFSLADRFTDTPYLSPSPEAYDSPDGAAHYHTFGPELRGLTSAPAFGCY